MEKDIAVICYHKNAASLYPASWLQQYRNSIEGQIGIQYDIFEVCYGGDEYRIFDKSEFEYKEFPTFVDCMNYLIDKCFALGYKAVANTNVDDYYSFDRLVKQWPYILSGFDIVASDFSLVQDSRITHRHFFSRLNVAQEIVRGHNIICHPSVMYSAKFWNKHRYNADEIPREDLLLWKRAITNSRMIVLPFNLTFHRIHSNAVSKPQQNIDIR